MAFVAMVLLGCDTSQPLFGPRVIDVEPAERRTIPEVIDFAATFEAPTRVEVRARTQGYLLERGFEDGTEVEQDQTLFVLQADEYEAAHRAALAVVDQREVELAGAETARAANPEDPDFVRAVDLARAALEESRARAAQAETELHYTTLRAPIEGRIDAHEADVGNLVARSDRLATIVQLDPIHIVGTIGASDAANVLAAQREGGLLVQALTPAGEMHERTGRIDVVGGEVDPDSGRVVVRGVLPNPRTDLLAGQTTIARLLLRWHVDAVVVPERAIDTNGDADFVAIVGEDDVVQRREVEIGPTYAGYRVVLAGLEGGERVVVGRRRVAVPGRRVRPEPTRLAPRPTPALAPRTAPPTPTPSPAPTLSPAPVPTPLPAQTEVANGAPAPIDKASPSGELPGDDAGPRRDESTNTPSDPERATGG